MKKNEKDYEFKSDVYKRIRSQLILGIGLFLLLAVALPLCVYFDQKIFLYVFSGVSAVLLLLVFILFIHYLGVYDKDISSSLSLLSAQLEDFSNGSVRLLGADKKLPFIEKLQDKVNAAISKYSEYRLVSRGGGLGETLDAEIKSGKVFGYEEFRDILYKGIVNNLSFRSSLLYVQALEDNSSDPIPPEVMSALHEKILRDFPSSLVGRYDNVTYVVYLFAVDSFLGLENSLNNFVTSFNKLSLASSDGPSVVYHCKVGAVVYPYTPMTSLLTAGLDALKASKEVYLNTSVNSVYFPHGVLSESARRVVYLASLENFESDFKKAKTLPEQIAVLKNFVRWYAAGNDFDCGGVLTYDELSHTYRLLFEEAKIDEGKSFSRFGPVIEEKVVDPFYLAAEKDNSFAVSDASELPSVMANVLSNINVKGLYLSNITSNGKKLGLAYFTSVSVHPFFSILSREHLETYSGEVSSMVASILADLSSRQSRLTLDAALERSNKYVYSIDRPTHTLTYLSANLMRAFPKAHLGDVCYKVLRSEHTAPCTHCPLEHGVDRRIINNLSNLESTVSVLEYRSARDNESSLLIEQAIDSNEHLAGNAGLIDEMLLIKNQKALSLDFNRQMKLGGTGYVLSVSLLNPEKILDSIKSADSTSLMGAILRLVVDGGYGDILYREDTYTLSFDLRSYTKQKIYDFAEEIAGALNNVVSLNEYSFTPHFAFSAISYPNEIDSSKGLIELIGSELKRSEGYGNGYLVEVSSKKPRRALRSEYILDVLNATLAKDELPVYIQPVVDNKTGKTVAGDIVVRLYGRDKVQISPSEFLPIAQEEKLISKIDLSAFRQAGVLYENYAFTYFKSMNILNLEVHLSASSLLEPGFVDEAKKIFARYKFSKGFIVFAVEVGLIVKYQADLERVISSLSPLGAIFEVTNYSPDKLGLDVLNTLGIHLIKTAVPSIKAAVSNQSDYASMARFSESAVRLGYFLTVAGIDTPEENDLAIHLLAGRNEGYLFSKPLEEKDFITYLNFGKQK